MVVFVRKHAPEIQYLRASISERAAREFGRLVETTINQIEAGHFNPRTAAFAFPQNGCVELLPSGPVSEERAVGSSQPDSQSRSERP